jgi:prepilin-type N-terminal cleavage/methylation domain-containing protein
MTDMVGTNKKGFTLLELLIVIAIIAVLAVLLIIVLDPSETLKRARDSQRVSDLNTIKSAIGLYLTETTTPQLGNTTLFCLGKTSPRIFYSVVNMGPCNYGQFLPVGSDAVGQLYFNWYCSNNNTTTSTLTAVDGTGWLPINFLSLSGGSPISNLPVDPINTVASSTAPNNNDLVYRYLCQQQTSDNTRPANAYQLAAVLESALYGPSNPNGLDSKDGGQNPNYYEVGSDNRLMPATNTSW